MVVALQPWSGNIVPHEVCFLLPPKRLLTPSITLQLGSDAHPGFHHLSGQVWAC